MEEPGYGKIRKIYAAAGATCRSAPMDGQGVCTRQLEDAQVLHLSPSHHFPTGLVTPVRRRLELLAWAGEDKWIIEDDYDSEFRFDAHPIPAMQTLDRQGRVIYMNTFLELLAWAGEDKWIIEDDYDSEFRFDAHPIPAMQTLDRQGRVIYMNTFSRSLAPSIRISYLVLPGPLMERFQKQLGFYSCTVPSFEQYTLARFLSRGHFEKHINRMRKFYKNQRNALFTALRSWDTEGRLTLVEQDAGVHFLLGLDTSTKTSATPCSPPCAAGIRRAGLPWWSRMPGCIFCWGWTPGCLTGNWWSSWRSRASVSMLCGIFTTTSLRTGAVWW